VWTKLDIYVFIRGFHILKVQNVYACMLPFTRIVWRYQRGNQNP